MALSTAATYIMWRYRSQQLPPQSTPGTDAQQKPRVSIFIWTCAVHCCSSNVWIWVRFSIRKLSKKDSRSKGIGLLRSRQMAQAIFVRIYYLIIAYYYLTLCRNETAYLLSGVICSWRFKYLICICQVPSLHVYFVLKVPVQVENRVNLMMPKSIYFFLKNRLKHKI
jgi:hypothetical protein